MAEAIGGRALPAGLIVHGEPTALIGAFAALAALQPVRWSSAGLICAPRAAPEVAARALARCPLPHSALDRPPGWPTPAAAMIAGWYRRGVGHAAAPTGIGELVICDGEGFGPIAHPTTAMCLAALADAPPGPAVDAGCGAGLLAQAWARRHRQPVLAIDADPRAIDHCARSVGAAGLNELITVRRGQIAGLGSAELTNRAVIANVPIIAQRALLERVTGPAPVVILSGVDRAGAAEITAGYLRRGMRVAGARRRGRWHQRTLLPA